MNREIACEVHRRLLLHTTPSSVAGAILSSFDSPFQSLILTILSAQTTDRAVNKLSATPSSPATQRRKRSPVLSLRRWNPLIKSIGFHRAKARYIVGTARILVTDFGGEVPRTIVKNSSQTSWRRKKDRQHRSLPRVWHQRWYSRRHPRSTGLKDGSGLPTAPALRSSSVTSWSSSLRRPGRISTTF
jgi:hypothetical protein